MWHRRVTKHSKKSIQMTRKPDVYSEYAELDQRDVPAFQLIFRRMSLKWTDNFLYRTYTKQINVTIFTLKMFVLFLWLLVDKQDNLVSWRHTRNNWLDDRKVEILYLRLDPCRFYIVWLVLTCDSLLLKSEDLQKWKRTLKENFLAAFLQNEQFIPASCWTGLGGL